VSTAERRYNALVKHVADWHARLLEIYDARNVDRVSLLKLAHDMSKTAHLVPLVLTLEDCPDRDRERTLEEIPY
jgi:uncharacterized protein YbjT (DUF2867 family)